MCEWFALCTREPVWNVYHPILASVPTCNECVDKLKLRECILSPVSRH